jgi:hypothetical protein
MVEPAAVEMNIEEKYGFVKPDDEHFLSLKRLYKRDTEKIVLEIQPEPDNTLVLKFIRKSNQYTTLQLMRIFLNYAKEKGYEKVKLEDDALFSALENCSYRSLLYRAFQGKPSIYTPYEFIPENVTTEQVNADRNTISTFTIGDAKRMLGKVESGTRPELQRLKIAVDVLDLDNSTPFGAWITSLYDVSSKNKENCIFMQNVINELFILSKNEKIDVFNNDDDKSKQFLRALKDYYNAHQSLVRNLADYVVKNGNQVGGRRYVRRTSRVTRRKQNKSRMSRKSRRNY